MNTLYYGDNLKILRDEIKSESVDLVYLDPPFNSNRNYNVLFKNESGVEAESQITAFEDTWHWNLAAEETYHELINEPDQVGRMIESFRQFIGNNQMMAYLVMMAVRLKELHRILKPTGSLYLHCDPTASHYLKILLDTIFGAENFRNEIAWKRYGAHNDVGQGSKHYGRVQDIILFYPKSQDATWNQMFMPLDEDYIKSTYSKIDEKTGKRYTTTPMTGPGGAEKGNPVFEWNGHTRAWRYSKETMQRLHDEGKLYYSKTGYARQKLFLEDSKGVPVQSMWTDISSLSGVHAERMGYPTQKPVALLERIIQASSNEGDIVLDPFCGCGTTIAAAQKLKRTWIGIDITHLSVGLQKLRLRDTFKLTALTQSQADKHKGELPPDSYVVVGQPEDLESAKELAERDKYAFQWWILPLIGAKAFGAEVGSKTGKKGADGGIDGMIVFTDDHSGKAKKVIVSVKGGHVNVAQIRDLGHVVERENAAIGIFLTLEPPTKPMIEEAVVKGFYESPAHRGPFPRIQILTVEDLLNGKLPTLPPNLDTFKQSRRILPEGDKQNSLFDTDRDETTNSE